MRFEVGERQETPVEERVEVTFEIADRDEEDGYRTCVAYLPTAEQAAYLARLKSRYLDLAQKISGVLEFMNDVMPAETDEYLARRMRDPNDPFDFGRLMDVVTWLANEFRVRAQGGNRAARRAAERDTAPTVKTPAPKAAGKAAPRTVSVKELAARAGVDPDAVMAASDLPAKKAAAPRKAPAKRPASKPVAARRR